MQRTAVTGPLTLFVTTTVWEDAAATLRGEALYTSGSPSGSALDVTTTVPASGAPTLPDDSVEPGVGV